jgi:hypothetical protein
MSEATSGLNGQYKVTPFISFPIGSSSELIYFPVRQVAVRLSSKDVSALRLHPGFCPLDTYILNGADPKLVAHLAEARALLSKEELFAPSECASVGQTSAINWIVIPTCERPGELDRALQSYIANLCRFGRKPRFFISDDSGAGRSESRHLIAHFASRYRREGIEFYYSGLAEKSRFATALSNASGVSPETVHFALFGAGAKAGRCATMGANRNSTLLQTQGDLCLSVDDDTICRMGRVPEHGDEIDRLRIGPDGDPTNFWFFDSHEAAINFARWENLDLLSEHERLLGRSVLGLLPESGSNEADLREICGHAWRHLSEGAGRVRLTFNGVVGDSAMHSGWLPHITPNPATWTRLSHSEESYTTAVRSRQVIRHASSLIVGHCEPCVSMAIGMDNRDLLPPFFPVGRNEDGVFGRLMERCVPKSHAGHLPWALLHRPPGERIYALDAAKENRISAILLVCIGTWPGSPATRTTSGAIRSLGRHLLELADLGPAGLHEVIQLGLWQLASGQIRHHEALLAERGSSPAYWANGVRRQNDLIRGSILAPAFSMPCDLPFAPDEAREQVHQLIRQYGQLLCDWPAMVQGASQMATAGIRLGLRV